MSRAANIKLASGGYLDLLNPKPEQIHIEDIAHGLSHICRFNGQTKIFYSVAQHCIMVSELVPQHLALEALLHDASEAYIGDVITPLKHLLPDYLEIEENLERVIRQRFGISLAHNPIIKKFDKIAVVSEKYALLDPHPLDEVHWHEYSSIKPLFIKAYATSFGFIKSQFLARFRELTDSVGRFQEDLDGYDQRAA